jgi:hypothetical protein
MMHDKAMRRFGAVISSLVCGAVVACAGGDTPAVNDDLEDAISANFRNGGVAVAGGAGGRAPTASAGSAGAPVAGSGGAGGEAPAPGPPVAAGGAAGAPPATETPPPSTGGACNGFAVLNENCSGSSCHSAGGVGDFAESEDAALAFVGVSGSVTCGGEGPLLNPDSPKQSIIVQKVNGTVPCGGAMPIGSPPLTDDEISCLEEWIATL